MTIDTKKLRELAEAATPGPWTENVWFGTNEDSWTATGPVHEPGDDPYEPAEPGSEIHRAAQRDAAFIAAANPQAVIALLDALDACKRGAADMVARVQEESKRKSQQLAAMTALATEFANRCAGSAHPAVHAADMERIRKVGQP